MAREILQRAKLGSLCGIERVDRAVAEIANQQRAAELAEGRERHLHSPRRVERSLGNQVRDQISRCVKHIDESVAGGSHIVMLRRVLLGVSHIDHPTEIGDSEGSEAGRNRRVHESLSVYDRIEAAVEHIDYPVMEIGNIQNRRGGRSADDAALKYRVRLGVINWDNCSSGVDGTAPT